MNRMTPKPRTPKNEKRRALLRVLCQIIHNKMNVKYCSGCKMFHEKSMFFKSRNTSTGLSCACKAFLGVGDKQYREKNKEKIALYRKLHKKPITLESRLMRRKYQKKWFLKNKARETLRIKVYTQLDRDSLGDKYIKQLLKNHAREPTKEAILWQKRYTAINRINRLINKVERGDMPITEAKKEFERLICLM